MIPLLLLVWVCASGALLAGRLDPRSTRWSEGLALGAPLGLSIFAGFGFVLGWALGLSIATVLGAAALTAMVALIAGAKLADLRIRWRPRARPGLNVLVLSVVSAITVVQLADRTLFETQAGVATADRHNFGDLPFHMSIAAGFAYGENFPPDHPELAGVSLTYPFFCDLLSGMLLVLGASWRDAFFWPTLILGLSVIVALVRFGEAVTGSRALGRTAAGLTLLSGGLGVFSLTNVEKVQHWWAQGPDLTMNDAGLRYANFVTTMFIPQRSILFGWPLLFFALALLLEALNGEGEEAGSRRALWLRAGVVTSLLPLVHSHSFAVMALCLPFLAVRSGRDSLSAFLRGVAPLAGLAIVFMLTHNSLSTGNFFSFQPGFDGGADQPLRFWLMNGGLFFPLVAMGIAKASSLSVRASAAAPFVVLFGLANLFRLSPWIWDNMKFLAPAHAGLAPFAALALLALWRRGRLGKVASVMAFVAATLSGGLDISKVAWAGGEFAIFSRTDFAFAERVRESTAPRTTILTAPTHNHPVLLSGRRVFLGYEGHLWSQGLDYTGRKPVADALFRGEPQPTADPAAPRVDAVAFTPAEASLVRDPDAFARLPSLVDSPYRLLKIQ